MYKRFFRFMSLLIAYVACPAAVRAQTVATATPQLTPDVTLVGQSTQVTITVDLSSDATLVPSTVVLYKYDGNGNFLGSAGPLFDDGSHGDVKAGDGIYTTELTPTASAEAANYFKVSASHKGSLARTLSNPVEFDFVSPLTSQQATALTSLPQQGATLYQSLLSNGASLGNAQAQTIAWLNAQPDIVSAQAADNNSSGIWMLFTSGILGGITVDSNNTRGGAHVSSGSAHIHIRAAQQHPVMFSQAATGVSNTTALTNKSALILDTFPLDANDDEAPSIFQTLGNRACGTESKLISYSANRAAFQTLNQYGIVAIVSIGDTWFGGLGPFINSPAGSFRFPLLVHINGEPNFPGSTYVNQPGLSQVVVFTGEPSPNLDVLTSPNSLAALQTLRDLKDGYLAIGMHNINSVPPPNPPVPGPFFVITPAFVRHYDRSLPDSIVYVDACRSLFAEGGSPTTATTTNPSMASAFLDSGAGAYLGMTEYTLTSYGAKVGTEFFANLITQDEPVGVALSSLTTNNGALDDPSSTGATGPTFLALAPNSAASLTVPACTPPAPDFEFLDGAPGNLTIYVDSMPYNFTGLGLLETESLGFSSLQPGNHTIAVYANGGFADYTINLPAPFTFSFGGSNTTNRVISITWPVTYQFSSPTSPLVKVTPQSLAPRQLTTAHLNQK